jgi:hypothetical protein
MFLAQGQDNPHLAVNRAVQRRSPQAVLLSPFAVILSPLAVILSPFAVILSPFAVILSPLAVILSPFVVILSEAKNLALPLRVNFAKDPLLP